LSDEIPISGLSRIGELLVLTPVAILAALMSIGMIVLLTPWLRTYASVHPNVRSSHVKPTPQGGGAAVIAATFMAAWAGILVFGPFRQSEISEALVLTGSATLLAVIGAVDDIRVLPAFPRLVLQSVAVAIVIASLPPDWHIVRFLPWWVERIGLVIGGVWFVNLTNFMDGIDWMTVAEVVPITIAIALFGAMNVISLLPTLIAMALLGAVVGFAPFNKPVAKLFLGDVGSLPIGLLLGWLLSQLAGNGHLAAAVLLGLYYLADATITLFRRIFAGERIWQAHRSHFYQRALDRGFTVTEIVLRVFVVNLGLAALALAGMWTTGGVFSWGLILTGCALVAWLLARLTYGKR
jgi:UDP-N-acetylmuramyl pentapeptide phosphotransferase/UDP-N-acetylglucosamine-1-phosphate transferase